MNVSHLSTHYQKRPLNGYIALPFQYVTTITATDGYALKNLGVNTTPNYLSIVA